MATAAPPFKLPVPGVADNSGPWQVLELEPYSDGDQKHWPGKPSYRPSDERAYKVKVAAAWSSHLGVTERGVNYYLQDLPSGYSVFETVQPVYKRLFGHPSGRYYDSILRFQTHFFWLMSGMEGDCDCVLCGKLHRAIVPRAIVPRTLKPRESVLAEPRRRRDPALDNIGGESTRSSSASGLATGREKRARGSAQTYPTDEEGTPDVYKECIQKLCKNKESRKGIKDDIIEEDSIDREAERETLTQYLTRVEQQHSFVPRLGELVLWCTYFPDDQYLLKDTSTNEFKFFSFDTKTFSGFPDWRAGVVTAVPNSAAIDGAIDFSDILGLPSKKTDLNSSGFRVETIPDPNKKDKSASKQYQYLPLRSIRPLAHWQYVLCGFPKKRLHPSIYHALTLMTSISLLDKYEFTGEWPNGSIHCKGIYIGSELITIGDAVRVKSIGHEPLKPDEAEPLRILLVSSIRMNLLFIEDCHADVHSEALSRQSNITLVGSTYTNSPTALRNNDDHDHIDPESAKHLFRPVGTNQYGPWYPVHSLRQRNEVSHDQVIGRLHEPYAIRLWAGEQRVVLTSDQEPERGTYSFDLPGILAGRRYASQSDERIPAAPPDNPTAIMWHLADYRAKALDIALSNGLDVGPYDEVRTPKTLSRWRAFLKIIRGDLSAAKDIGVSPQKARAAPFVDWASVNNPPSEREGSAYRGKRRGRPPGSRVVDGKLVLGSQSQGMKSAAREETESDSSNDEHVEMTEASPTRRPATGLDRSTSFEQRDDPEPFDDEEENIDDMLLADFQQRQSDEEDDDGHQLLSTTTLSSSKPTDKGKAPLTKQKSTRSVETGSFADSDSEEDESWWEKPTPFARGGTEESEGGDYDPKKESQEERQERKMKERVKAQSAKGKYLPTKDYRPWVRDW